MKPFQQNSTGFTKQALVLNPDDGQSYSATIQQTPVREKLNQSVIRSNRDFSSMRG